MLNIIYIEAKKQTNIFTLIGLFITFFALYVFLDFEGNTDYFIMTQNFGLLITVTHIVINVFIAILTSVMVTFSMINYRLTKVDPKGSNSIPFITFIFGLLTFGCTGCVVAFLSSIGIAFTPILLPNGNLIWKLAALLFVIAGFIFVMYQIKNTKCKVNI